MIPFYAADIDSCGARHPPPAPRTVEAQKYWLDTSRSVGMVNTNWSVWSAMQQHQSKARLLDATIKVVRTKGYNATRIEDVCAEAGVTKGSFFHHFKSKDDLALAALDHWKASSVDLFAHAPYHHARDPLDRVLAYV